MVNEAGSVEPFLLCNDTARIYNFDANLFLNVSKRSERLFQAPHKKTNSFFLKGYDSNKEEA